MLRNLVFDIGNVLFYTEWERAGRFLEERYRVPRDQVVSLFWGDGWKGRPLEHFLNLSEGSEREFHRIAQCELGVEIPQKCFWRMWNCIFVPNDPLISLLERLHENSDARLIICSNINAPHHRYLRRTFPAMGRFHGEAVSYRVRVMKPDKRMFQEAERFATTGARSWTIFVDDREENVDAAVEFGWRGFRYRRGTEVEVERLLREELDF